MPPQACAELAVLIDDLILLSFRAKGDQASCWVGGVAPHEVWAQAKILPGRGSLVFIDCVHVYSPRTPFRAHRASITSPSTHAQAHPFLSLILLLEREHKQALPHCLVTNVVSMVPGLLMLYFGVCCCLYFCIPLHAGSAAE